jgi:lysophospholipase L1-like esterase
MSRLIIAGAFAGIAAITLRAQAPNPLLSTAEVNALCLRSAQLMDAGGIATPDLGRAAAPVVENVKQACTQLKLHPNGGQPTYALMMNVRTYLALTDAIPKPYPFPEAARQQLAEVRETSARLDAHFRALLDTKDAQLVAPDHDDLGRYADANRKLPAPQPGKPRVVFLGDSITDLWRLNEYFPDRDFINRGIGGQVAAQMLARMKQDVIDLHPAAVVILAGTNDLARETALTAIEDDYLMLADLAAASRIKVIFASVLPVSDAHRDVDPSYERTPSHPPLFIRALNDWLKAFCLQRGYVYLDYYPALADNTGQFAGDLSDDGLHPNAKGYRVMAPLLTAAVSKAVGTPAAPPLAAAPITTPNSTSAKTKKGKDTSK